ncbi:MAG: hypothetical protein HZA52_18505 [Planctomycetes bacterium]|nr:hypothetical protein [Planctomycetota bacterium]
MRLLTTESFRSLLTAHPAPCVSVFMPTERGPRASDLNRVRYEHLLQRARNDMHPFYSPRDIDPVLEPLTRLPGSELWDAQHAGVAAFASRKFHLHFQLTDPPEELVIVGDSFHVRPLLAQLQTNRHYFLLNLNQKHAQLYRGTRRGLVPVALHGVAFEVAFVSKERERTSTQHSGGAGFGIGIHHGQQGGDVGQREELQQYFREIDRAMQRELAFEKAPMVLAAPRELHTTYRMLSRYAHIAEEALHGNFDSATPSELHEKAWPIVQRELAVREGHLLDDFDSLAAHGRASADLAESARCAMQGRVRELFLADGEHVWGRLDRDNGSIQLAIEGGLVKGDDLLDDIAEAVLARGGEVLALERSRMPGRAQAAALLRW